MKTPREIVDNQISEATWQQEVLKVLRLNRWEIFVIGDSRRVSPGILDILAIRPPRVAFIECKTITGQLTKTKIIWEESGHLYGRIGQTEVVAMLEQCPGVEVYVLRPQDFERLLEIAK